MTRPRFKVRDLLILILLFPLIATVIWAVSRKEWEAANRAKCAKQLRSLGQAIMLYRNDNRGQCPRARYQPSDDPVPTWGTGVWANDPFASNGPGPNDVTASLFLLVRTQDITMEIFTCPSTSATPWDMGGRNALQVSNWPRDAVGKHLSYSYFNGYLKKEQDAVRERYESRLNTTMGPVEFPWMADLNPGLASGTINVTTITTAASAKVMRESNSPNHARAGQNVLYHDGRVDFQMNPFVGVQRDNIYVRRAGSTGWVAAPPPIAQAPYDVNDSVLLPCAER
jgi:hypothetical protein